ncbi:MAG: hypothetical protein RR327_04255 [Clostridia bacterium]
MKYILLTSAFYAKYANCPEIEHKVNRPYIQIVVKIENNIFAVPLRSNINHNNVLWTDKANKCGIDFSKAVIITDYNNEVDKSQPYIRQNEFNSLRGKEYIIQKKLENYIKTYKEAKENLNIQRNIIICKYSTLQYFEDLI